MQATLLVTSEQHHSTRSHDQQGHYSLITPGLPSLNNNQQHGKCHVTSVFSALLLINAMPALQLSHYPDSFPETSVHVHDQ